MSKLDIPTHTDGRLIMIIAFITQARIYFMRKRTQKVYCISVHQNSINEIDLRSPTAKPYEFKLRKSNICGLCVEGDHLFCISNFSILVVFSLQTRKPLIKRQMVAVKERETFVNVAASKRHVMLTSTINNESSVQNNIYLFTRALQPLSNTFILMNGGYTWNFIHKIYLERIRNYDIAIMSIMIGAGGIWAYWINPQNKLILLSSEKVSESGIMDLCRVSEGEYIIPAYQNTVYALRLMIT